MTNGKRTIVVDGLSALRGGGQTYLINLFRFLPKKFRNSLRVIALVPSNAEMLRGYDGIEYITSSFASRGIIRRLVWTATRLPLLLQRVDADVLYCPGGFVSVFGSKWKSAVAFRNMLPFIDEERRRFPFGYLRARLALLRLVQGRSFKRADLVIFLSQFSRSVIDNAVGLRAGQSMIISHGVSDDFRVLKTDRPVPSLPYPYVAYVSVLNVYKAQVEVVRAWAIMRNTRLTKEKLLFVGAASNPYAQRVRAVISELGLLDEVIIGGELPYSVLPSIYQGAVANVFASSCENCPNILLEALAAGKPVLSSNYQPMPEFAGTAALYFDPYKPETLSKQLCLLLDDPDLCNEMGRRARERSLEFQWKESAEATWQALGDLADPDDLLIRS